MECPISTVSVVSFSCGSSQVLKLSLATSIALYVLYLDFEIISIVYATPGGSSQRDKTMRVSTNLG